MLDKVEEAQKHGALNKSLQNQYNKIIQNADGRVFVEPKSGMLLIVKNIKLQDGQIVPKVFVKTKHSPDAVELFIIERLISPGFDLAQKIIN